MNQKLALEILIDGHNVLLTGPAGSGKTYLLREFIKLSKKSGKNVAVTATTGLAATHLGGNTIHAWSGIGIQDKITKHFYDNLTNSRRDTINNTDILIIDEISMLHDFRFDMIDEILRQIRGEYDKPFGGIQLVLCGDFFQLPPVNKNDNQSNNFIVSSTAWLELEPVICYLDSQHRQNDNDFVDFLNYMRAGDLRQKHLNLLLSRKNVDVGEVTELHTTNVNVDRLNHNKLASLNGDEFVFEMETTGRASYVDNLKKSCLANENLILKKDALVMFIKNSPDKKYVNGSLGQVVGFEELTDYPIIKLKNGKKVTAKPESWELRDGDKKRASVSQIPLRLAYAITVHKSQGMTLDGANIDLSNAFVEGMGYVALSRLRSLQNLNLLGINRTALMVSPEAIELDKEFRSLTKIHSKKFEHLQERAKNRKQITVEHKSTGNKKSWADKLAEMRKNYPNAYKPWTQEDDEKLITMFTKKNEIDIKKLTKIFGRHPGSIKSRLIKHLGEDSVV